MFLENIIFLSGALTNLSRVLTNPYSTAAAHKEFAIEGSLFSQNDVSILRLRVEVNTAVYSD